MILYAYIAKICKFYDNDYLFLLFVIDCKEKEAAEVGTKRKNSEFHNCEMEKKPKVEHQHTEDDTVLNKTDDKDVMEASLSKEKEEEVFDYRFSLYSIYCKYDITMIIYLYT